MKKIISILLVVLLVGCASNKPKLETTPPKAPIPSNLLVKCPEIEGLEGNTLGDLYKHDIELMKQYTECATRHDRLIDAVK